MLETGKSYLSFILSSTIRSGSKKQEKASTATKTDEMNTKSEKIESGSILGFAKRKFLAQDRLRFYHMRTFIICE